VACAYSVPSGPVTCPAAASAVIPATPDGRARLSSLMELSLRAVRSITQPSKLGLVQRTSFEDMTCSVAQCLDAVGEWWSLLIVRDAFLGVTRFDDFRSRLGISRNILTQRLNHLVAKGILTRVRYQDHPPRFEYRLTGKGRDLWHVITAMRQWGDTWAAPGGPPVEIRHKACGHVVTAVPTCSRCGEPLEPRGVTAIPGPGALPGDFDRTRVAAKP
jgi:DNA-binding HxlR family transcriptional regulator